MALPLCNTVWQCFTKLNIIVKYNPAIIIFGIYTKELKTVSTKTCIQLFIGALFKIAKT